MSTCVLANDFENPPKKLNIHWKLEISQGLFGHHICPLSLLTTGLHFENIGCDVMSDLDATTPRVFLARHGEYCGVY